MPNKLTQMLYETGVQVANDVRVVEIYRGPAEVPGQYLDSNAKCGVILIWTKRGLPAGG